MEYYIITVKQIMRDVNAHREITISPKTPKWLADNILINFANYQKVAVPYTNFECDFFIEDFAKCSIEEPKHLPGTDYVIYKTERRKIEDQLIFPVAIYYLYKKYTLTNKIKQLQRVNLWMKMKEY